MVCRGLSETVAIIVLIGLVISFSIAFIVYMQGDYGVRQGLAVVQRVVEFERMNIVVRLIYASMESAVFLFKRLDGGDKIMFFIDNGTRYIDCMDVIENVSSGAIVAVGVYSVDGIMVVSRDGVYSYRYYAKARGLPDSGVVKICVIEVGQNSIATLALIKPIAHGYNYTMLESYNRAWRLYGSLRFRIVSVDINSYLYIDNTRYPLRVGQNIRVDVDGREGVIKLNMMKKVEEFNVFAKAVYVDDALLARNVYVSIVGDVAIDIIGSSLSIEILPEPPGYIKLVYQGQPQLNIEEDSDNSYIKVVGWNIDSVKGLTIQLNQDTLYSEGIADKIYIIQNGSSAKVSPATLRLYIIAMISNTPYLIDVYEYKLSSS